MSHCSLGLSCEPIPDDTEEDHIWKKAYPYISPLQPLIDLVNKHEEKIEKLENCIDNLKDFNYHVVCHNNKQSDRITALELKLDAIELKYHLNSPKQVFKCPVCNGAGQWELESIESVIANGGSKNKDCHACEGKGILWG